MIFITNKYTKYYFNIINNAKQANRKKLSRNALAYIPYDRHHIIPDCFFKNRTRKGPDGWVDGNSNSPENLVYLLAREHFICHWLLTKMVTGKNKVKMINALSCMQRARDGIYTTKITSRVFNNIKSDRAKIVSDQMKGRIPWNKGKSHSAETKEKMQLARKLQVFSAETKAKMVASRKFVSDATKAKLSASSKLRTKKLCPHCLKEFLPTTFGIYHGDKCKLFKSS